MLAQVFVPLFRIFRVLAVLRVSHRLVNRNYFSLSEFNYARCFARNMLPGQRSILRINKQSCKWTKDVQYDVYNRKSARVSSLRISWFSKYHSSLKRIRLDNITVILVISFSPKLLKNTQGAKNISRYRVKHFAWKLYL